jgi:hypothetical protein
MRRRQGISITALTTAASLATLLGAAGPARAADASSARPGGLDDISAVSCISPGNCAAAGHFTDSSGHGQVFVISQTRGTWGRGRELPGIAALNTGHNAVVTSLACGWRGNCTVAGWYSGSKRSSTHAFLADERNGRWGKARQAPGTAALSTGDVAAVTSVSCSRADSCGAVGTYRDRSGDQHPFVLSKVRGTWRTARQVPGIAALNTGGFAQLPAVSCASPGNCSAGGSYAVGVSSRAFVVDQRNGRWGTARRVPGAATLGLNTQVTAVSCASAGNCSAGGTYENAAGEQAFVVSEVHGTWRAAIPVPGLAALNTGGAAALSTLSCGAPGSCSAGGSYTEPPPGEGPSPSQAYVVTEVNGHWGTARPVPGARALNTGKQAEVTAVSCGGRGSCGAVGTYLTSGSSGFLVSEAHGVWGRAQQIRGLAALKASANVELAVISCAGPGSCLAGGSFEGPVSVRPLLVSENHGVWARARSIPGF